MDDLPPSADPQNHVAIADTVMQPHAPSPAEQDVAACFHPYTNLQRHRNTGPLVIDRGEGIYVFDPAGNRYIDALAGLWCVALGFSEPRLVAAGERALRRLPFYHMFGGKVPVPTAALAERLLAVAPVPMSKVFFASSGSEANDTAIKLIWYYNNARGRPRKKKLISRRRAYHGVTIASGSLTGLPINHRDFDLPFPGVLHVDCPHYWRNALPGETEEEFAQRLADGLEALILEEDPETIAAFFAEPVMGAGGVIVPPATYFDRIQAVLRRYDILLVVDEVICGFGRTGTYWGSQRFGIKPDMMVCGKALSSGYQPISALLVNEAVFEVAAAASDAIGVFGHGFTYSGHPVAAAVALETLAIYEERAIVDHVAALSPRLQDGLRSFAAHPLVGEVRGVGLVGAVELVRNRATGAPFDAACGVGARITQAAEKRGLIIRVLSGDVVAFSPPLIIDEAGIDAILQRFGDALEETWTWARDRGIIDE